MTTAPSLITPGAVSSASANTLTIPKPAGVVDGDYLIVIPTHQNQPPSDWTSSGWGRIGTAFVVNDADMRGTGIFGHPVVTASSEPSTYPFVFPGTGRCAAIVGVARGVDLSNPVNTAVPAKSTAAGAARTMPSFTIDVDNSLLIVASNNQATSPNAATATIADGAMTQFGAAASPGDTTVTRSVVIAWDKAVNAGASGAETVTWAGAATGAAALGVALRPKADVAPTVKWYIWDGSSEKLAAATRWDGTNEVPVTSFAMQTADLTLAKLEAMPLTRPWKAAHRFGSANWVEFSARSAKESAEYWGVDALEVSVVKSSDGTWWCSHDTYLDRMVLGTATTTMPFTSYTDAQIRTYTQTAAYTDNTSQPREKLITLDEVDALYPSTFLIIEDKTYANQAALMTWINAHGGAQRCMWKQSGPGTRFAGSSTIRAWGYFFAGTDMTSFAAKQGQWDYVGVDYQLTDTDLAAAIATATPARTVAHIIPSVAQANRLLAYGIRGLMVANVRDVIAMPWQR